MNPSTTLESVKQLFASVAFEMLYLQFWYGDKYEIENYEGAYPVAMFMTDLSTYRSIMVQSSNFQTNIAFSGVLMFITKHETDTDTEESFRYTNEATILLEEFVNRLQQKNVVMVKSFRVKADQYWEKGSQFTSVAFLTIDFEMPSGFDFCLINPLPVINVPPIPPIAFAGENIIIQDVYSLGVIPVTLNGSISTPQDGAYIASYIWTDEYTVLGEGETIEVELGHGLYEVTLTVTDSNGLSDSDTILVLVQAPTNLILVDCLSQVDIGMLGEGSVFSKSEGSGQLSIRVRLQVPDTYQSCTFALSGAATLNRIESLSPYTLNGDTPKFKTLPYPFVAGDYNLITRVWTGLNGTGTIIFQDSINFTVT